MRVLATTLPSGQRVSSIGTISRREGKTRARCEAKCAATPECRFFSFGGRTGRAVTECTLCIACDLEMIWQARFQSFAKGGTRHLVRPKAVGDIPELSHALQALYSEQLYGAPGRIDFSSLRVLWLDLLPRRALESLARVGVCNLDARLPHQPLFYAHDVVNNPRDAVWVHRLQVAHTPPSTPLTRSLTSAASAAAVQCCTILEITHCTSQDDLAARALPNHSWVEVTHCPRPKHTSAMWLYEAPGSGVSINLGRTLIVNSVGSAKRFLRARFIEGSFSRIHPSCDSSDLNPTVLNPCQPKPPTDSTCANLSHEQIVHASLSHEQTVHAGVNRLHRLR